MDHYKYKTEYHEVDNLEDLGEEDFVTGEELSEAGNSYGSTIYKCGPAMKALIALAKKIPKNKKSIVIDCPDLSDEFLLDRCDLEKHGLRTTGGRLYNCPVEQKQIRKSDFISLRGRVYNILRDRGLDVTFGINHGQCKMKLIQHFKKIVTWKEVCAETHYSYDQNSPNGLKTWIRKMWLDPTIMEGK